MADKIDKREFSVTLSNGQTVNLFTRTATNEELQDSEFEYSKVFNKAIIGGIVPQSTLISRLAENGIWNEDKDRAIGEQRNVVIELEQKLEAVTDEQAKEEIIAALKIERDKLYKMRQERTELMAHSAEAKAEEVQRNYLVSRVTSYASTGKPVWKNFDLYRKEPDGNLIFRTTYEYLTFINGLPSDFMNNLPENKVAEKPEVQTTGDSVTVSVPAEPSAVTA